MRKPLFQNLQILFLLCLISCFASCGSNSSEEHLDKNSSAKAPVFKTENQHKKFVFIGDSLTAGYGVSEKECFVGIIQRKFQEMNLNVTVVNAGISGEMSDGTLNRIDWILDNKVETVFLCIGGNDGLRGKSIESLKKNIEAMIKVIKNKNIELILAGMQMPPNYSKDYTDSFRRLYSEIAVKNELKYLPFLLDGVAGHPAFNLTDGVHPNKKGHQKIAKNIIVFLKENKVYLK